MNLIHHPVCTAKKHGNLKRINGYEEEYLFVNIMDKFEEQEEKIRLLQAELKLLREKLDWSIGIINVVANRVDKKGKREGKGGKRKKEKR